MNDVGLQHEIFALVIIVVAALLLLLGGLTGEEWVMLARLLGLAVITGKAAEAIVTARSAATAPASPTQP